MAAHPQYRSFLRNWGWLIVLVVIKLILHISAAGQYGFHRDEFLYLVQGQHPAWGYMEVPPLIGWLAAFIQLFGNGIVWIKLFPALAGSVSLILVALITRDLGGGRWARITACLGFLLVPAYLRTHHLFQPVFLNQLFWLLSLFALIRIYKTGIAKYWYLLGVIAGIGILAKYSMIFLGIAILAGILISRERRWLSRPQPYYALLIAVLIASPNILWQYFHNFPVLAHMAELRTTQLVHVEPGSFIAAQFLMLFGTSLLWFPGLLGLLGSKSLRRFRVLGWTYLVLLVLLLVLSGKAYYLLGVYPPLIAAGAAWWERIADRTRWIKIGLPVIIVLLNLTAIPYGLPILPVETMQRYSAWMQDHAGLEGPLIWEDGTLHRLPQDYADMHGWEEMAQRVSEVYHTMPTEERSRCNIWGGSYSHASTLTFYRDKYDLPEVHSFVGSHVLWIPDSADFDTQIMIDDVYQLTSQYFNSVELVDSIRNPHAREKGYIYFRSDPKIDVAETWHQLVVENRDRWQRK